MDRQDRVASFIAEHDLAAPPAYRLLDLTSELGELAKEVNTSTSYGDDPDEALDTAVQKYENRLAETDTPASGE